MTDSLIKCCYEITCLLVCGAKYSVVQEVTQNKELITLVVCCHFISLIRQKLLGLSYLSYLSCQSSMNPFVRCGSAVASCRGTFLLLCAPIHSPMELEIYDVMFWRCLCPETAQF